jgi:hypothetical protein
LHSASYGERRAVGQDVFFEKYLNCKARQK